MTTVLDAPIILTDDQQAALTQFTTFLVDPADPVFVLEGYSGTGKSTLVKVLLDQLPALMKTARLINPGLQDYDVELTATTNKAAEALSAISGMTVVTIHSFLGLRVQTDYKTGETTLIPRIHDPVVGKLIFIDEASFIDRMMLGYIFKLTRQCKIVFMGDRAQLTQVKSSNAPVFEANFPGAMLSKVVRQPDLPNGVHPITELATKFRETVSSGEFFSFKPDGYHIQYLARGDFEDAILAEFTRPDWRFRDSKILGWTNKCVIAYNHAVRNHVKGDPCFQEGDYAVCNKFITVSRQSIKTDQLVQITRIGEDTRIAGVLGNMMEIDGRLNVFCPKSLAEWNALIKQARAEENYSLANTAENEWIDLRSVFAQTINKSQGSTYDRVFIDLDDIRRCNSGEQIARMLYVGVSRARHQVFFTGDLVAH